VFLIQIYITQTYREIDMKDLHAVKARFRNCSTAIKNGRVLRRSNFVYERIIRFLFWKIDFDGASLSTLKELEGKGRIVFASFQSSSSALLILTSLLRRHGFRVPMLALGVAPFLYQRMSNVVRLVFRSLRRFFLGGRFRPVADRECIRGIIDDHESVVVSLLSRKLFLWRYLEKRSDPVQDIIEIQMESPEPIFLVPELIFWNMNPERTRNFIAMRATGDRGLLSALFTTIRSATHSSVRVSTPINLKEMVDQYSGESPRLVTRRVRQRLFEIYNLEKRSALGPVLKTSHEMMESVLYHPDIINAIQAVAEEKGQSVRRLRRKAYKYYRGIAADFSILVIKYFQKFMMWVFRKVFDDVYYDKEDFRMLREAAQKAPLIIMPCHRSHMDYLIISSMFYENRLVPPHILAGDNLSFFPLGLLFRKSGAFFMKRSTRGLDLYTAILRQYIKTLVQEGYSIEFFIEGGRTRTGKTMHPKLGMLKYLIEAVEEGYNDDMMLVPVGINYDRVLEEKSFQRELKGRNKESESNKDLMKSGKYLRGGFGGVHLSFGAPMSFRDLKREFGAGEDLVQRVADRIVRKISDAVVVTPFALVTAAMLVSSVKGFALSDLRERVSLFMKCLKRVGAKLSGALSDDSSVGEAIDMVLEYFEHDGIVSRVRLDGGKKGKPNYLEEFYVLNEEQRMRINFYKNNIIHYFLPVSLYASGFVAAGKGAESAGAGSVRREFSMLAELFSKEFVYTEAMCDMPAAADEAEAFLEEQGIVARDNGTVRVTEGRMEELLGFSRLMQDVMEAYYAVSTTLSAWGDSRIMKKEFIAEVRKAGMKRFHLGEIMFFESLSQPYYSSALSRIAAMRLARERKTGDEGTEIVIEDREGISAVEEDLRQRLLAIEEASRSRRRLPRPAGIAELEGEESADRVH